MSTTKQKLQIRFQSININFTGQKANNKHYIIGGVSCKTLAEVEQYLSILERILKQ